LGVSTRITDLVGRLGGEEFAVLMPETALLRAAQVAERIGQATRAVKAGFGRFTASVGLTQWDGKETLESALGRDRVEVVEAPDTQG
jgi:diguanylate cyclase (GGDEF)-like protein